MKPSPKSITQLLIEWSEGTEEALDELMPLVYEELRRMAHRYMRGERRGHTLQTTALANEIFVRFADLKGIRWQNRAHFYAVAAQAMRRILVDHARRNQAQKRQVNRVSLEHAADVRAPETSTDVLALHEALTTLEAVDPRKCQVVVMKYFGGMTDEDTGEVLGISTATVTREWKTAKLHLLKTLTQQVE
ncbi:MAG TPA: sigma-70 family RNA polymerase sigma factor [Pyrinomonadaceae bacterium]|nr:sigma-70 family RNA polymerase sigma factor [Pyrinomonadaceae bacterium]